jgi:hypothetical protein
LTAIYFNSCGHFKRNKLFKSQCYILATSQNVRDNMPQSHQGSCVKGPSFHGHYVTWIKCCRNQVSQSRDKMFRDQMEEEIKCLGINCHKDVLLQGLKNTGIKYSVMHSFSSLVPNFSPAMSSAKRSKNKLVLL